MTAAQAQVATRRVLFVDDEPNLLAGLRRMLRGKRDVWEMEFAEGGEAALALMAQSPVDVVVSDMRMPGMDGAQLLAEVRRSHPRTARIILSGHADRASIISAVGPTQQYLAKPCELDALVAVLDRVLSVRDLVVDERLREILGGVDSLPKPPHVYEEMLALATDPDCRLEDVVSVIERDVATSAEVLRLVNSAFFCLPSRVDDLARAVSLLGLETIQALAIAGAVFSAGGAVPDGIDVRDLSDRGLLVATVSRRLASAEGWPRQGVGDAFFAGMLHEVGLLVLARHFPDALRTLRAGRAARGERCDLHEQAQRQRGLFGCTATDASAYLLGMWGFSEPVVEAIVSQPASPPDPAASPAALLLTASRHFACSPDVPLPSFEGGYLTQERVDRWDALARQVRGGGVVAAAR